jgi:hypothetical protein
MRPEVIRFRQRRGLACGDGRHPFGEDSLLGRRKFELAGNLAPQAHRVLQREPAAIADAVKEAHEGAQVLRTAADSLLKLAKVQGWVGVEQGSLLKTFSTFRGVHEAGGHWSTGSASQGSLGFAGCVRGGISTPSLTTASAFGSAGTEVTGNPTIRPSANQE